MSQRWSWPFKISQRQPRLEVLFCKSVRNPIHLKSSFLLSSFYFVLGLLTVTCLCGTTGACVYSHGPNSHILNHSRPQSLDLTEPYDTNEVGLHIQSPMGDATEWDSQPNNDDDVGGPMGAEDPELGLEECDKEQYFDHDSEPSSSESDFSEMSEEGAELYSTYEFDY